LPAVQATASPGLHSAGILAINEVLKEDKDYGHIGDIAGATRRDLQNTVLLALPLGTYSPHQQFKMKEDPPFTLPSRIWQLAV
jgi:hypothetical protein